MKKIIIGFLIFSFFGCAPTTIEKLKEAPTYKDTFTVKGNYQPVYRKVLHESQRCFYMFDHIQGEIYTDTKSGVIRMVHGGFIDQRIYMVAEIFAIDEISTKVTVYCGNSMRNSSTRAIKQWLISDFTGCRSEK
jgi:hypothetical protein